MTTRDTFAAAALPVVMQQYYEGRFSRPILVAEEAYFFADQMMQQKQIEEDAARTREIVAEREVK